MFFMRCPAFVCLLLIFISCLACSDSSSTDGDMDIDQEPGDSVDGDPDPDDAESEETPPTADGDDILDGDSEKPVDGDMMSDGDDSDGDGMEGEFEADGDGDLDLIDQEPETPVAVNNFYVFENPANVLSFFAEWSTDKPAQTVLDVNCGGYHSHSYRDSDMVLDHKVFVMGLADGWSCTFTARSWRGAVEGSEDVASVQIEVGPLPDFMIDLEVEVLKKNKMQPGWTLFHLANRYSNPPTIVSIVDEEGRYRWYYRRITVETGSATTTRIIPEGLLISGKLGKVPASIVDWEGTLLWEEMIDMHHDLRLIGEGSERKLLFLRDEEDVCAGVLEPYKTGGIKEVNFDSLQEVWSWRICDHYLPPNAWNDWHHLNNVMPFPNEDAYLLSSRNQSMLFKIDRASGDIIWKMGKRGDFVMLSNDWFGHQHAAEIMPNGHILMFDNGLDSRGWSRALELAYNENNMTVEIVHQYRHSPDLFSGVWGDADRLANGNTLTVFGLWSKTKHSHITESTASGETVWDLKFPLKWGIYRGHRTDPLLGYVMKPE